MRTSLRLHLRSVSPAAIAGVRGCQRLLAPRLVEILGRLYFIEVIEDRCILGRTIRSLPQPEGKP
jgi:hypothetical protein